MLIYLFAPKAGTCVLRAPASFDITAWAESRQWAFRHLGITRITYEML
jgi:hypothetical protein